MELLYEIERSSLQKVKNTLLLDDVVGRASIVFKDGNTLGFDNKYFCYISGADDINQKAEDLMKDLGKKIEGKVKEQILTKIKDEENQAIQGFGGIFG